MAPPRRTPPPPLEGNDRLITAVITAGWAVALIVVLSVRASLPGHERWWVWTCVGGVGLGFFGLLYVPHLQRRRAQAAARHPAHGDELPGGPEGATGTQDSPSNDSNTVSSSETPGSSTRS